VFKPPDDDTDVTKHVTAVKDIRGVFVVCALVWFYK